MPQGSGQFPKSAGDIIYAGDFNRVYSTITTVLSTITGYGVTPLSTSVSVGNVITFVDWNKLRNDVRRIVAHRTNVDINSVAPGLPVLGSPVDNDFINTLTFYMQAAYQDIQSNLYTVHPNQLAVMSTSTTKTATWGDTIQHTNLYSWANAPYTIESAFNLGGYFGMRIGYANASGSADDLAWVNFLNTYVQPAVNAFTYTRTDFNSAAVKTISDSFGGDSFEATLELIDGNVIRSSIFLTPASGRSLTLDVTSTSSYYYSTNASAVPGILAPAPAFQNVSNFNDSGSTVRIAANVSSLSFGPTIEDTQSSERTFRLTNFGTLPGDIISVSYGSYGDIFATGSPDPAISLPITLGPTESYNFKVSYFSANIGTYTPNIVFEVNKDPIGITPTTGTLTIPVTATVVLDNLIASASPLVLTANTRAEAPQQVVNITANRAFTYTAQIDTLHPSNFQIAATGAAGPTIQFYCGSLVNPGSYTATLTLNLTDTISSKTAQVVVPITANLAFPADYNIGVWQSAGSSYNSIVGASYDLIGGIRTITLGFAAGADGGNELNTGPTYMYAPDLNFAEDNKFDALIDPKYQKVMYPALENEEYTSFLNANGVWIRYQNNGDTGPAGSNLSREFRINIPQTAEYFWQFNVDNAGDFSIDGNLITAADLRISDNTNYNIDHTGSLGTVNAGVHSIGITFRNDGGPAAVALVIKDSDGNEIWNLRNYVRGSSTPYRYWKEVYRIPFPNSGNGTPVTAHSNKFIIKDYSPAFGDIYGRYFGTPSTVSAGSFFTVVDDGFGNMNISINDLSTVPASETIWRTLNNATLASFYYSEADVGGRFYNLESPLNETQTRRFTGFNSSGTTQTVVVSFPTVPNSYPGGSGGGSGVFYPGFEWVFDPDFGWILQENPFDNSGNPAL